MAAVAGARPSMLNPNAPIFIPAAFRQVEDFSPEWWELVKTSAWFQEYWLSEHQEETFAADDNDGDLSNLLPESFDIGFDEEFLDLDAQFEDFLESKSKEFLDLDAQFEDLFESESKEKREEAKQLNGNNAKDILRSLSLPKSGMKKMMKPRYIDQKAGKCVSPRPKASPSPKSVRRIQQPR